MSTPSPESLVWKRLFPIRFNERSNTTCMSYFMRLGINIRQNEEISQNTVGKVRVERYSFHFFR